MDSGLPVRFFISKIIQSRSAAEATRSTCSRAERTSLLIRRMVCHRSRGWLAASARCTIESRSAKAPHRHLFWLRMVCQLLISNERSPTPATDVRIATQTRSRGSLHLVCWTAKALTTTKSDNARHEEKSVYPECLKGKLLVAIAESVSVVHGILIR